ncbi:MAG: hypothetical protein H6981_01555 [Gammaproteobacteria bacterium]|nr:hypothetical protein [Gammaproteobacteria bacterium]MCP5135473.1 hypothetical protein [Gammaproteobacteria bacterium]
MTERQRGVTQIEVLIGIVLTATLVLGLIGLWTLVDAHFIRLQWRQKAIFELNAQTERIAALYRYTAFVAAAGSHADNGNTVGRWIYRGDPNGIAGLVVSENKDSGVTSATFGDRQILYMDYPGPPTDPDNTNTIWIDRDNRVTGELSWTLDDTGLTPANCWNSSCYRLTVRLAYPYRLVDGVGAMVAELGEIETLTLQTLVGQRASSY